MTVETATPGNVDAASPEDKEQDTLRKTAQFDARFRWVILQKMLSLRAAGGTVSKTLEVALDAFYQEIRQLICETEKKRGQDLLGQATIERVEDLAEKIIVGVLKASRKIPVAE